MKLTSESKFLLGVVGVTLAIIVGAIFFLSQPAPTIPREQLVTKTAHTKGNPKAKVYLVEFSDFQCPACKGAKSAVDAVVEKHKNDMLFVYRHFPLDIHPFSHQSAEMAEIAGAQGKFWEMYDLLFANQEEFSDEKILSLASELKLDMDAVNKAVRERTYKDLVDGDLAYGTTIAVNATPTFYLNGQKLNLLTFGDLETEVAKAIEQAK